MTNIPEDALEFPTDQTFTLVGQYITVKKPYETTRIPGVHVSMDNLHSHTRKLAISNSETTINILSAKFRS
jgi:hypothetical protein